MQSETEQRATAASARPTIRPATEADLAGAKHILDAHRHELGFVRLPALRQALDRGWLYVAAHGEELLGVIDWWARRDGVVVLYNIAVLPPARGTGLGRQLVGAMVAWACTREANAIRLKCPEGLPANAFYQSLGFRLVGSETGKRRLLNHWELSLPPPVA